VGTPERGMTEEELASSLSPRSAAIVIFAGSSTLSLATVVQIANKATLPVPVILDAAACLPPVSRLWEYVEQGADCVVFSGGKAIRGPQSSGFIVARNWIVEAAHQQACPKEQSVCRAMKTSKESIVGLVAALEAFVFEQEDYPHEVNFTATLLVDKLRDAVTKAGLSAYTNLRVQTGADAGVTDVQPNMHMLVFVDLVGLHYDASSASPTGSSVYGSGVDHGSPLVIEALDAPTWLAAYLAKADDFDDDDGEKHKRRIASNTTASGLMFNPILLTHQETEIIARRVVSGIRALLQLRPVSKL
jgi:hypothetical protein